MRTLHLPLSYKTINNFFLLVGLKAYVSNKVTLFFILEKPKSVFTSVIAYPNPQELDIKLLEKIGVRVNKVLKRFRYMTCLKFTLYYNIS